MMKQLGFLLSVGAFLLPLALEAQHTAMDSISAYLASAKSNSGVIPQEKVYLHLDNTSYYRDDKIFFAAYVTTAGRHLPTPLSGTLYVELLNPGGKIVDRRVLRIVNGRCHGELTPGKLPFYSGYYEIRAYTKYMLNFGDDAVYSRVIPVFDRPKKRGDYASHSMLQYGGGGYEYKRPKPVSRRKVDVKFYPEGGHLVEFLPCRLGLEITDATGRPVEAYGRIVDTGADTLCAEFRSGRHGKGAVEFVARGGKYKAIVDYDGREYKFDIPSIEPRGIALQVDNLSSEQAVEVTLRKSAGLPVGVLGATVTCRGELYGRFVVDFSESDSLTFSVPKAKLPSGVAQLTVFTPMGEIVADRLFFHNREDRVEISVSGSKSSYAPFEPVELEFHLSRRDGSAETSPFSLSVADAENHAEYGSNILADLLLASEIRGYVHNPAYYFSEAADPERRRELDCLLMVQGWRKYPWRNLVGIEAYDLEEYPERGIEVRGKVVSAVQGIPKSNVSVSTMMSQRQADNPDSVSIFYDVYTTDSLGQFAFRTDVDGKWLLIFAAEEKGKKKGHRLLLNRSRKPALRPYDSALMHVDFAESAAEIALTDSVDTPDEELKATGMDQVLKEVEVVGRKDNKEWEIAQNRESSIASYEVAEEYDAMLDDGERGVRRVNDLLVELNRHFVMQYSSAEGEKLLYKGKEPLFVIDYKRHLDDVLDPGEWKTLFIDGIKSIYINENPGLLQRYVYTTEPKTIDELQKQYSCTVLIETYPDRRTKMRRGARRIILDGYSPEVEFYSPDYSLLPIEADYRRTLYWNPSVEPDSTGTARVRFYNNATARRFTISAESVTPSGRIAILPR